MITIYLCSDKALFSCAQNKHITHFLTFWYLKNENTLHEFSSFILIMASLDFKSAQENPADQDKVIRKLYNLAVEYPALEHLPSYYSLAFTHRNSQKEWRDSVNISQSGGKKDLGTAQHYRFFLPAVFFEPGDNSPSAQIKVLDCVSIEPCTNHELSHNTLYQNSPCDPIGPIYVKCLPHDAK